MFDIFFLKLNKELEGQEGFNAVYKKDSKDNNEDYGVEISEREKGGKHAYGNGGVSDDFNVSNEVEEEDSENYDEHEVEFAKSDEYDEHEVEVFNSESKGYHKESSGSYQDDYEGAESNAF